MKLNDSNNYYSELNESSSVCAIYFCLLMEQISNKIKNINILLYGINILHHVFNFILFYTKNLPLTLTHSKNAYVYYIEFIEQIKNKNNLFLKLKKEDAALFVYKKTIFNINKNNIKNNEEKDNRIKKIHNLTKKYKLKTQRFLINNKNKDNTAFFNKIKEEINNYKILENNIKMLK